MNKAKAKVLSAAIEIDCFFWTKKLNVSFIILDNIGFEDFICFKVFIRINKKVRYIPSNETIKLLWIFYSFKLATLKKVHILTLEKVSSIIFEAYLYPDKSILKKIW